MLFEYRYQKYTHESYFLDQATGIYYEGLADLANRLGLVLVLPE